MKTMAENLLAIHAQAFIIEASSDHERIKACTENIHVFASDIEIQMGLAAQHNKLVKLTTMLDEHPEGWDGECHCQTCRESV